MKIFISYTSTDKSWAEWIAWHLEEDGHQVTIQAWDFLAGTNFVIKMQEAINDSDITIAVLSKEYLTKPYATAEWAATFAQDPNGQLRRLLPVRIDDVKPTGLLAPVVYLDLFQCEDEPSAIALLIGEVDSNRKKPNTAPAFPQSKVQRQLPPPFPNHLGSEDEFKFDEKVRGLDRELSACRMDRFGKARKKAISTLIEQLDVLPKDHYSVLDLQVRLWQQKLKESRNRKDFISSAENIERSYEELFAYSLNAEQEYVSMLSLVEWSIDFSQIAGVKVTLNKIVALLDRAIKYLSLRIGLDSHTTKTEDERSQYLCLRAKCKRALASTYQKRTGTTNRTKKQINKVKLEALHDAERANDIMQNNAIQLELSLCLFANSGTTDTENAKKGMSILNELHNLEGNILASYEYIKQLRMRHKFEEAIVEFIKISGKDKNRLRFHQFITHFNASVIGLYYNQSCVEELKNYALEACRLTEEVISHDHHGAREIVDLCYLKGISGFPIEKSIETVDKLRGSVNIPWKELAEMAQNASSGQDNLLDALFWGLDDPAIWSRIGTFFSDFAKDYERALEFYGYASEIDPASPVYHFNKARIYAFRMPDHLKGKAEIDFATHLKSNKYGWYKNNEEEIQDIKSTIYNMTHN